MLPILRFGVCRSSDLSIHVRRIFPRANALLQPSLRAMTALPMTGFHRTRGFPHMENNTLELQLLSESCFLLCTLWFIGCRRRKEIPSVSGILTRFPCSANKNACPKVFRRLDGQRHACLTCPGRAFATKAMLFNCSICALDSCTQIFLSKIYIPILPQSEVIVKWYFFRSCGRIFRRFASVLVCRFLSEISRA